MRGRNVKNEFVRFLLVGAINTIFSYLLYLFLLKFLDYLPAYSVSYCVGIVGSYFLNVYFVFRKNISAIGFIKFPVVYVAQYCLGVAILWLFVHQFGVTPAVALVAVIIITIPITFLISRCVLKK